MENNTYQKTTNGPVEHNKSTLRGDENKGYYTLYGKAYYTRLKDPLTSIKKKDGTVEEIKPQFRMELGLSAKGQEIAQNIGLTVNPARDDIKSPYLRLERKVKNGDVDASRPKAFDAEGAPFNIEQLIGNGSDVKVKIWVPNDTAPNGKKYPALMDVQVISLVPYEDKKPTNTFTPKKKFEIPSYKQAAK
jgi:hypothetical protein